GREPARDVRLVRTRRRRCADGRLDPARSEARPPQHGPARGRVRDRRAVHGRARQARRRRRRGDRGARAHRRGAVRARRVRGRGARGRRRARVRLTMDLGLEGRTAIVCGASAGMGLAIAEALAKEGANVAMFARRRDLLEREAERIGALAVRGDLTVPADLEKLVERTLKAFGGIDVLVNNGGGPPPGPAVGQDAAAFESAVELLLLPVVRLTALCLPHLEQSGRGRIVNIESSSVREPIEGLALSNAVRPGVVGWAKTLAREIGQKGITINTIAPGRIDTDRLAQLYSNDGAARDVAQAQIPLRRFGAPAEIARVVCFLASDQASYMTGTVVPVDGGLTRSLL